MTSDIKLLIPARRNSKGLPIVNLLEMDEDETLAAILKDKGYPIARRTVAKYREQLEVPVARLRKKM